MGFEPTNDGFAIRSLRPLGHSAEIEQDTQHWSKQQIGMFKKIFTVLNIVSKNLLYFAQNVKMDSKEHAKNRFGTQKNWRKK